MNVLIFFRKLYTRNKKKTIYQCFNPILRISAFGGMSSITEYNNNYVLSHGLVGYQIFIILLNVIHVFFIFKGPLYVEKQKEELLMRNDTEFTVIKSDFIIDMAKPLLISVSTLALRVVNLALLPQNLPNIFRNIDNAKRVVDFKDVSCKDYTCATFLIFLMLLLCVPNQINSVIEDIQNGLFTTLRVVIFTFNHYNNFSAVCLDIQFSYMCYMLKNRFHVINEHLKKPNVVGAFESTKESVNLWHSDLNKRLRSVLYLRDCHHKLCECCEYLNKLYNIQFLITLTNCLINVMLNFYFAIYGGFGTVKVQLDESDQSVHNSIKQTIWGMFYFIRFVEICASAEILSKEANLTKKFICDFLAYCSDTQIKDVLWIFHAFSVSSEVKFTAFGFFKIDLSLISSAISAGTTYLVILAQFHGQKKNSE